MYNLREVSRLIKCLDSTKVAGPDKIKNLNIDLSAILLELFNRCLTDKSFPNLWNMSTVFSIQKDVSKRSFSPPRNMPHQSRHCPQQIFRGDNQQITS